MNKSIWRLVSAHRVELVYGCGADGSIVCYDVDREREVRRRFLENGWVNGLGYCFAKDLLVAGTAGGLIAVLNPSTLAVVTSYTTKFWINSVRWNNTSGTAFVGTGEGVLFCYDVATPSKIREMPLKHTDQIWDCITSDDGEHLVTVGGNGEIALWKTATHTFSRWIGKGGYVITSAVFLEPFELLATVDMGGGMTFWSLRDRYATRRFNAHDARIWAIAVTRDRRRVVTVAADKRVRVWSIPNGQLLFEHTLTIPATTCATSNYDNRMFAGDVEGRVLTFAADRSDHLAKVATEEEVFADVAGLLARHRIVAFILGGRRKPLGEYSRRMVDSLDAARLEFVTCDVTNCPLIKGTLVRLSGCPLFPQLYLDGRFYGGSEIASEMTALGALQRMMAERRR